MFDQRWLRLTSISREVFCFSLHGKLSPHTRVELGQNLPPLRFYAHQRERCELLNHDVRSPSLPDTPVKVFFKQELLKKVGE